MSVGNTDFRYLTDPQNFMLHFKPRQNETGKHLSLWDASFCQLLQNTEHRVAEQF